jgi:hypothetical protein
MISQALKFLNLPYYHHQFITNSPFTLVIYRRRKLMCCLILYYGQFREYSEAVRNISLSVLVGVFFSQSTIAFIDSAVSLYFCDCRFLILLKAELGCKLPGVRGNDQCPLETHPRDKA